MRSLSHFVKSLRSPSLSPSYISAAFKTEGSILTQDRSWAGSSIFQGVCFCKNEEKFELCPAQIQNRNLSVKSDAISVVLVLYTQSKLNKISKENQMVSVDLIAVDNPKTDEAFSAVPGSKTGHMNMQQFQMNQFLVSVPTQSLQEQPCMTWGELSLESLLKRMVCKRPQLGPGSLEDHVTPAGGSDLLLGFASYGPECKICEN